MQVATLYLSALVCMLLNEAEPQLRRRQTTAEDAPQASVKALHFTVCASSIAPVRCCLARISFLVGSVRLLRSSSEIV